MKDLGGKLQRWCKQHEIQQTTITDEVNQKKKPESLSKHDIEELMDTRKRVHRRGRGGALKQ